VGELIFDGRDRLVFRAEPKANHEKTRSSEPPRKSK